MSIEKIRKYGERLYRDLRGYLEADRRRLIAAALLGVGLLIFVINKCSETTEKIYYSDSNVEFKKGRLIDYQNADFYKKRDQLHSQRMKKLIESQEATAKKLQEIENKVNSPAKSEEKKDESGQQQEVSKESEVSINAEPIRTYPPPETYEVEKSEVKSALPARSSYKAPSSGYYRKRKAKGGKEGPPLISFPVKKTKPQNLGVTLPSGSFVKAKILTGVDAPQGKAYPSLLALDYAFIAPNNFRVDLSGCFVVAKAQGDLSTERVQMQPTKLSCVSRRGKMFEREITGYVADNHDNNFALTGKISSKRGRVMAMAFLSSIVEGIGKAIQQAQTTQQTNAVGGSSSVLTGDQGKYLVAGGASNAASMVTQWYLNQAQGLLPTINVGAGRNIWVVMTDKVELPNEYFKKNVRRKDGLHQIEYLNRLFN